MILPELARILRSMDGASASIGRTWSQARSLSGGVVGRLVRDRAAADLQLFRYRVGDGPVAEDLTSVTFEKAWAARHRFRRDRAGFGTWVLAIARNVAVDHFRRTRRHAPLEEAMDVPGGERPDAIAEHHSDLERLAWRCSIDWASASAS